MSNATNPGQPTTEHQMDSIKARVLRAMAEITECKALLELYNVGKELAPDNLTGETEYCRFTVYHNGNVHLEFQRLDQLSALAKK